jgi:eukaryotic-like serine/threonine-protein kinase
MATPIKPTAASALTTQFDAAFWMRVNETLDRALELDHDARALFFVSLDASDLPLSTEVKKLLNRAQLQSAAQAAESSSTTTAEPLNDITRDSVPPLATALVRSEKTRTGLTVQLAPVLGKGGEKGFDDLLQRALRANRQQQKISRFAGERCGAWKLVSLLGSGGMGEVWLATRADGLFEARAAIKFLRAESSSDGFEARFAQERALLARLNHPGIARLLDAGHQTGSPFLVLEYVHGMPLLDYVQLHAPSTDARLALIRQIGEAVAYAHSQLVVHRDLKPSNVLVMPDGVVKLLDFGVAGLITDIEHFATTESPVTRLTGRGLTIEYAAPEQITGESSGVSSDVYSLGALAYHLLVGHRAYLPEVPGRAALEHAILHTDPARVSEALRNPPLNAAKDSIPSVIDHARVNADIDAVIAKAMRRQATDRYATAAEMVADLRRFAERRPISTRREDRAYRTRLWLRRNWLPSMLATTLFLALGAGLAGSLWQADRAKSEALRAKKTADYLSELLSGADPDLHGGNWPTVLNLIERAQSDLGTKFIDEPSVEQKLSQTVATTLRRLSRFKDALPVAQRSFTLSQQLYGDDAESTRMAGALLADVMYWLDRTEEALPMLTKVIGKKQPEPMPEWWREAFLLHANMTAEMRQFPLATAQFDAYRTLIKTQPEAQWLTAEAETDRALMLMTEGKHGESLRLHKQYRSVLLNPPAHAKRLALTNLSNGVMMQMYMGEPEGVEALFKSNISQWDQLAGTNNRHSIEALGRLALFYYFYERPSDALALYRDRLARLNLFPLANVREIVMVRTDILEVETKFFLQPAEIIIAEANAIEKEVLRYAEINDTTRQRLLQRLAMARLTVGDVTKLAKSIMQLPPPLDPIDQRADRAVTRWIATASLLAHVGKMKESCDALTYAADQWASQNRTLISVPLHLRAALTCTLASAPQAARHLKNASQSIPETIPSDHRYRRVLQYVEQIAHAKNAAEIEHAQRGLAEQLGVPRMTTTHPALLGLVF